MWPTGIPSHFNRINRSQRILLALWQVTVCDLAARLTALGFDGDAQHAAVQAARRFPVISGHVFQIFHGFPLFSVYLSGLHAQMRPWHWHQDFSPKAAESVDNKYETTCRRSGRRGSAGLGR